MVKPFELIGKVCQRTEHHRHGIIQWMLVVCKVVKERDPLNAVGDQSIRGTETTQIGRHLVLDDGKALSQYRAV